MGNTNQPEVESIEMDLFPEESRQQSKDRAIKEINRVLRDYSWDWSFLQEPLQNAIDSYIDVENFKIHTPPEGLSRIVELEIDIENDSIQFTDYGVGISQENFNWIRDTNNTSKKPQAHASKLAFSRTVKGFAGIGIKSTLFRSKEFELISVRDGKKTRLLLEDGYDFENKPTDEKIPLQIIDAEQMSSTQLKIKFPKLEDGRKATVALLELMVDEWMSNLSLKMTKSNSYKYANQSKSFTINHVGLHIVEWYLRTNTYAACVTRTIGDLTDFCPEVSIALSIKGTHEYKKVKFKESVHNFPVSYWSPSRILQAQKVGGLTKNIRGQRKKLAANLENVPSSKGDHKGYFEIIENKAGIKKILENHDSSKTSQVFCDEFVNGMILYIANPEIMRRDLKLPSSSQLGHSTRRLTVNGVPTRHNIQFEFHNYPVTHFVLDIDAIVTPDKGHFTGGFRGRTTSMLEDKGLTEFTSSLQSIFSKLGPKVASKIRRRDKEGNIVDDPDYEHKPEYPKKGTIEETILIEHFGRQAKITQEQDVIQSFSHYCAKNDINMGWISLHEKADLDSWVGSSEFVEVAKLTRKDANYAVLEFKRSLNQILTQDQNQIGQTLDQIDIIVVNDNPVDVPEGYVITDYFEDELGFDHGFYPTEPTCELLAMKMVWKGSSDQTKKKIKDSSSFSLVISLEAIMNDLEDKYGQEEE